MPPYFFLKANVRQLSSYVFYGLLALFIDTGVFWLLAEPLQINYLYANVTAWILSFLFTFFTNKFIIFRSKNLQTLYFFKEFISFSSCRVFTLFLGMALIYLCVDILHFNKLYSKILTNLITIGLNYIVSKYFIFPCHIEER